VAVGATVADDELVPVPAVAVGAAVAGGELVPVPAVAVGAAVADDELVPVPAAVADDELVPVPAVAAPTVTDVAPPTIPVFLLPSTKVPLKVVAPAVAGAVTV
jgi:hypothetical protein